MVLKNNGNNKVTIAKLKQKFEDYITHNDNNILKIETKQDKTIEKLDSFRTEVMTVLTKGSGKIKNTIDNVIELKEGLEKHKGEHKENKVEEKKDSRFKLSTIANYSALIVSVITLIILIKCKGGM